MAAWSNVLIAAFCVVLMAGVAGASSPDSITVETLLDDMVDLDRLAEYPDPPFICRQFSSYDRASTTPEEHDAWFANGDAGKYLRTETVGDRTEYVMMDAKGPGAIVRIWSANPMGTLRVYLDGNKTPAIEAPMGDLLKGAVDGFPQPLAGIRSRGFNLHFPIPYAKHCKVTSDHGGFYYHVNYRTYEAGTPVKTYEKNDPQKLSTKIDRIAKHLESPETVSLQPGEGALLKPGDSLPWQTGGKSGAIETFAVKVEADDVESALRELRLMMEFDNLRTVDCPLGDFFGAGQGLNPYTSLPMGITKDGILWSRWPMPYQRNARWVIKNTGPHGIRVHAAVTVGEHKWSDRSMHFHAGWKIAKDIPTRPFRDWNYVTIKGKGNFVGAALAVANHVRNWWGEGDEKIYIDGETFPSHFGTGTEDYFGYAWCSNEPFTHAYHNQPRADGPMNYGHSSVNRWHILDCIPFTKKLRFDMEVWHSHGATQVTMAVMTYWYGFPGASGNYDDLTAADLRAVEIRPYEAPRVKGAIEGEEMEIVRKTAICTPQDLPDTSNERHLWWRDAKPGDQLELAFVVPADGRYRVYARFVKAHDYGIARFAINRQPTGMPIDFYNAGIVLTDEIDLGTFDLRKGDNSLLIELVGKNAAAAPRHMVGLDYVRLDPVNNEAKKEAGTP